MGKVLVLYDSRTGYTAKMAVHVAEGARTVAHTEVRVKSVDEAGQEDIVWADGLAVGSPTNLGVMSWKMKRFWDDLSDGIWGKVDGKIACAFSSSGGWGGGSELACMALLTVLMNFGFLVFGVTDYVGKQFTLHYGAVTAGEPRDPKEIAACRRLGQRLAQWVAGYIDGRRDLLPGPIDTRGM
ncbi:MAG: flavodoxin domain-containing protein [Anaerolineae bacterium]|nr:flavodoxin domain-containing protein [Thermoflexales bacterium]MDW8406379.1 flavodoxin domain-containing protein [Anaerolineae bacterium]